jgi:hypothetical protein
MKNLKNGNSNIEKVLDTIQEEDIINHLTGIMAQNFEINDVDKCIQDILKSFSREKLTKRKLEIIRELDEKDINKEQSEALEKELSEIIVKLAK